MLYIGVRAIMAVSGIDGFTPAPGSTIPLSNSILSTRNGIGWLALIASIIGLFVSAGIWAIGAYSNNFQQTVNGKRGVAVAAVAALLVGLAVPLLNNFFSIGSQAN